MIFKRISQGTAAIEAGKIELNDIDSFAARLNSYSDFVQVCSLKAICCATQPFVALEHALSAIDSGTAFSRTAGLEFMLRLSAERQVGKALDKVGLAQGKNTALVISFADEKAKAENAIEFVKGLGFKPQPRLFEGLKDNTAHVKEIYGITEKELSTLSDLPEPLCAAVIERIALVALLERNA
jgi:tRNA threonylcarbamoyladenosine modification (KEOPS) complex Cgi121 subunit